MVLKDKTNEKNRSGHKTHYTGAQQQQQEVIELTEPLV